MLKRGASPQATDAERVRTKPNELTQPPRRRKSSDPEDDTIYAAKAATVLSASRSLTQERNSSSVSKPVLQIAGNKSASEKKEHSTTESHTADEQQGLTHRTTPSENKPNVDYPAALSLRCITTTKAQSVRSAEAKLISPEAHSQALDQAPPAIPPLSPSSLGLYLNSNSSSDHPDQATAELLNVDVGHNSVFDSGFEQINQVIGEMNLMNVPVKTQGEKALNFPSDFLEPFLGHPLPASEPSSNNAAKINQKECQKTSPGSSKPSTSRTCVATTSKDPGRVFEDSSCSLQQPSSDTVLLHDCPSNSMAKAKSCSNAGPAELSSPNSSRVLCLLQAPTSPSQRADEDTLTYLNQGQTYSIKLSANLGRYRSSFAIRLLYGKTTSALIPQDSQSWDRTTPSRSLIEIDKLASNQISDIKRISSEGGIVFSWESAPRNRREPAILAFRVNCLSTDFTTHRRGEKGAFLQLELTTAMMSPAGSYEAIDISACLIKVFKGGAERRLKQDQEKVQKALSDVKGKPENPYQGSQLETTLVHSDLRKLNVDLSAFKLSGELKLEPGAVQDSISRNAGQDPSNLSHLSGESFSSFDQDEEETRGRFSARPRVALKITKESTMWDVQQWLSENYFTDLKTAFKNYNGHLLLSLEKSDFIQICGIAEGIRMYTTLRHGRESTDSASCTTRLSVTTYTQTD